MWRTLMVVSRGGPRLVRFIQLLRVHSSVPRPGWLRPRFAEEFQRVAIVGAACEVDHTEEWMGCMSDRGVSCVAQKVLLLSPQQSGRAQPSRMAKSLRPMVGG